MGDSDSPTRNSPGFLGRIGVVGGGSIGVGWAIVFARAGHDTTVYEPEAPRRRILIEEVEVRLGEMETFGLLDEAPAEIVSRLTVTGDLSETLDGAAHVQECAPESLPLKIGLFEKMDAGADTTTTLASSSSTLTISDIAGGLTGRARCLLAHPGNPPYLIRVVELAPPPFTDPETVDSARELFAGAGMLPISVHQEIDCLVFNRLQGALLREALLLVRDGVIAPDDLDLLVSEGLARRWSVIGPLAVAELNTRGGIVAHAGFMGLAYGRIGLERGQEDPWESDVVRQVAEALESRFPSSCRDDQVLWRDRELMRLERDRRNRAKPPGR
ncbi:MAG: 3-hydroxyacyl-CoA dehydrogenase [Acidimicrobiia bacterium]|nr:3-hydroxyacyl-CoA dehydrogenase [Acidimicrobiia bacterium]